MEKMIRALLTTQLQIQFFLSSKRHEVGCIFQRFSLSAVFAARQPIGSVMQTPLDSLRRYLNNTRNAFHNAPMARAVLAPNT